MTYSKYPNQTLKIICINLVNHLDVWVPHKWKKSFLTIFPHAILYWNITKHPVFKTNFDGQWKVDTVQKYGVEENVGQVKWTTTNHTKGQSSSKEGDVVFMVELEGSPLLWASSEKPKDWFQQVLLPITPTESNSQWKVSRISQQKVCSLPSG